jgi:hypothetical protein
MGGAELVGDVGRARAGRYGSMTIALVPLFFVAAGILIRYAAFTVVWPDHRLEPYVQSLCRWDCFWYIGISEHGYEGFPISGGSNVGRWGFFPLYPTVIAGVRILFPLPTAQVAIVTSMALSYASCLVAWQLLDRNMRPYALYCAFLLAGPFSFFFTTFLSEPLFVLLTSGVFLALKHSRYLAAGCLSALLSATRLVGVFVVFATLIQMLREHRGRGRPLLSFPGWILSRPDLLVAILVSPAGLFAYMLYLHFTVGDGFAFVHVQRAFGRVTGNPVQFLWDALTYRSPTGWPPSSPQWSALACLAGLTLSAVLAWRRQYGAALFCTLGIVLPVLTNLASMVRYVVGLAPLILLSMRLLAASGPVFYAALILLPTSCYFTTIAWMRGYLALV